MKIREKLSLTHNKEIKEEKKAKRDFFFLCPYFAQTILNLFLI